MYIFAAFLSGTGLFYLLRFFPVITVIAFILSAVLAARSKRYLLIPVIALGFLYAFIRYSPPADPLALSSREVILDCITKGFAAELPSGKYANRADIRSITDAATAGDLHRLAGKEVTIVSDDGLKKDMHYVLLAKTGKDAGRLNPGLFVSERLNVYLEGIYREEVFARPAVSVWVEEKRDSLTRHLEDNFDGDTGILLTAITTGEWSKMSGDLKDAFSATGLAHLLSISGTHFGLFSLLIFGLFRLMLGFMPYSLFQRFTVYLAPGQAAAILSLPFMIMYLLISGAGIPALRSFIMIGIFLFGLLIGRKGFWLNSLLFAAFLICLWEPAALLSLSFQLSFLAVFFIGLSLGDREKGPEGKVEQEGLKAGLTRRMVKFLKDSVLLTLFVSLGTAPLVAYYFHYFSVVSPLANLVVTPFTGFVLVALSLLSGFIFIFTGYYPFPSLIAFAAELAVSGVKFFAALPFAEIRVPHFPLIVLAVFYTGTGAYLWIKKQGSSLLKRYAFMALLAAPALFPFYMLTAEKGLSVTYLDAGQGDCAVAGAAGRTIVIDTGRTGREAYSYLRYLGKKDIDALILTHADDDHSAGAEYLIKKLNVREIWDNGLLVYPERFKDIKRRTLERGDVISADGFTLNVLHPYKGFYTFADNAAAEENNNSLAVKLSGARQSFLFAADAGEEAEEDMVHLGKWLKSSVLKVAHHGSRFSTTEDFLRAVSPEVAVISVGRHNTYGHPAAETMERLKGLQVYRTDSDGAVRITETPGGVVVKTYKNYQLEPSKSLAGEWRNIKRLFARW